ncbi:hypothetical protein C0J52_02243 [Blattella germanica]|nr:hypothetical protein C0J52_02243 [Blattella germanica]
MTSVQERLKLKRVPIDTWSVKEKLCLASAVLRSGDQNWMSVSRALRLFGEPGRPADWFSQKSCALQYGNLLENVDTPKRKKRTDKTGNEHVETPGEAIVRNLTQGKPTVIRAENSLCLEEKQKERDAEAHKRWLQERQEKKIELERAWKPPAPASPHRNKKFLRGAGGNRRNSSQSEPSSEAESAVDSPMSEPLNIDVVDEAAEPPAETKPVVPTTPTSPLLTSLLKSPSPAPSAQSSILHSAITSAHHRVASSSPTIASLLHSSPGIPATVAPPPANVSSSLKNLVTSAIGAAAEEAPKPPTTSPAAGAPTLSMLLELPPSLPGKPLPELPVTSVAKPPSTTKAPGEVCHPQHQEMRMGREVGTDEPVEVVEVEQHAETTAAPSLRDQVVGMEVVVQDAKPPPEPVSKLIDEDELETEVKMLMMEDSAPDPAEVVEVPAPQNDMDIIIVDSSTLTAENSECQVVEIVLNEKSSDDIKEQNVEATPVSGESTKEDTKADAQTNANEEVKQEVVKGKDEGPRIEVVAIEIPSTRPNDSMKALPKTDDNKKEKEKKEKREDEEVKQENTEAIPAEEPKDEPIISEESKVERKKSSENIRKEAEPSKNSEDCVAETIKPSIEEKSEKLDEEKLPEEVKKQEEVLPEEAVKTEDKEDIPKEVSGVETSADKTKVEEKQEESCEMPEKPDEATEEEDSRAESSDDEKKTERQPIRPSTGGKTWKVEDEEEFEEKEKAGMEDKPRDKGSSSQKPVARSETPSTEDDKTNDASENTQTGVTRSTSEFQRDVMLMFLNSIMYNKSSHFVHKMAKQMQQEGMQHIQDFLTTQMLVQVVGEAPLRRETRTTEANKQRDLLNTSGSGGQEEGDANSSKRKRPDAERGSAKKRKVFGCGRVMAAARSGLVDM